MRSQEPGATRSQKEAEAFCSRANKFAMDPEPGPEPPPPPAPAAALEGAAAAAQAPNVALHVQRAAPKRKYRKPENEIVWSRFTHYKPTDNELRMNPTLFEKWQCKACCM
jgi:hypothetical protein